MIAIKNKFALFLRALTIFMMLALAVGSPQAARAEVGTDQEDYAPGSVVTLSGNNDANGLPGYAEGHAVNVSVLGPNAWTAACSATVAADGAWSCTITLDSDPAIAVGDYTYVATSTDVNGDSISENGTFTDGPASSHSCILTTSGGVKCWGLNSIGQLGDGTTTNRSTPVDVFGLTSGVTQVSAAGGHTCALTTSGGLKCWGENGLGMLGDGTTANRSTPVDVFGLTSGVTQVSAGAHHTCALTTSGGVKCWGAPGSGRLGDGTSTQRNTPVDVFGLTSGVTQVSAGDSHTCAVTTSGGVKCWGTNSSGQLGIGTSAVGSSVTPRDVLVSPGGVPLSGVTQVRAGAGHTCALTTSGGVKCWGNTGAGVGDGTVTTRFAPVDVIGLTSGVTQLSTGSGHTCALTTSGGLKCWGQNTSGQLGDGTTTTRLTPVDVLVSPGGVPLSSVTQVSTGSAHTCALATSGIVKCWGMNTYGQLGDGTTTLRLTPVDVSGLTSGVAQLWDWLQIVPTDNIAPIASPTQSPAGNGLGWNNTDVTVTWNWTDVGGSGIDNANCTTSTVSSGEGNITLNATCKDLAGNTSNASYEIMVDKTAPTAQAGEDQHTHAGVTVHLDGSTSFDNNTLPAALSYSWSFSSTPAGNTASLNNANTATPSFTPNKSGEYIAQLIVTDDAGNASAPSYVTLSSLNQAPTGVATATPLLPLLGQIVSLDGTASIDPDNDAISYQWVVTSKPAGSAASLTNATSASASITPDVSGTYEMTLTVSDFLDSGTPVTVSFVASTAAQFAQSQVIAAGTSLTALSPSQVTTAGNQNALGNFLTNAMSQLQKGNVAKAITELNKAIERTDGCALRGAPDGNGPGMDWVTTCSAQASIYDSLVAALQALQN